MGTSWIHEGQDTVPVYEVMLFVKLAELCLHEVHAPYM
jgi:hypothetical protein